MKKLFLLGFAFVISFSFAACDKIENAIDEENQTAGEESILEESLSYAGTWERVSTTLDGAPIEHVPATIEMTAETYHSWTAACEISGDLVVTDDIMDIFVDVNTCPVYGDPGNYVNTFKLSEDGQTLTFTNTQFGGVMVEVYTRVESEDED